MRKIKIISLFISVLIMVIVGILLLKTIHDTWSLVLTPEQKFEYYRWPICLSVVASVFAWIGKDKEI